MTDFKRRPAYQWNVVDAEGDEAFQMMGYEQQGMFRALLDHQWREGSIPADPKLIFTLLSKLKSFNRFEKHLWPLIASKFQPTADGRLQNTRLERYRAELEAFCETRANNGRKGGRPRNLQVSQRKATKSSLSLTLTGTNTTKEQSNRRSATSAEPSATWLEFPVVGMGGSEWALTERQITEWQTAFPNLDIKAEAQKALAWVKANDGRRKTGKGMPGFLVGWLNRATNGGGSNGSQRSAAAPRRIAGSTLQDAPVDKYAGITHGLDRE